MPLGFERLNERTQRPNAHINFIRTLPGPSSVVAEQILNRVAAICYPFMKSNMILVQALEEYPYNTEFVGRNFNAGEVIQLVLRDRNGRWLSQRMVEMVMVHELAHCKQMNHSKAFWKVRNEYAVDLRALWSRGYTGEGLWGRGRDLDSGVVQLSEGDIADIPEHLCGGTYGRRTKKRKRGGKEKSMLSYAERKQRRILKKFGAGGQALGADDNTKVKLEGGVPKKGKPRVAGSARGRDLRAAAALARFDTAKTEEVIIKKEETFSDSETEEEFVEGDQEGAAVDIDGKRMFDDKGRALIKICEDEDDTDGNARREMDEIQGIAPGQKALNKSTARSKVSTSHKQIEKQAKLNNKMPTPAATRKSEGDSSASVIRLDEQWKRRPHSSHVPPYCPPVLESAQPMCCPMCSFQNELGPLTCAACSNVLSLQLVPDHWRCQSTACKNSQYINAGDAGACGVCATLRESS
ncbi:WLM domain-containing protein [Pyrenochaeta sp. MPI-SDFR-AT-0127]|nr:WLM domain-containing protein [Pyrenochaeta sp. MPI-SDFR-AT-0127]